MSFLHISLDGINVKSYRSCNYPLRWLKSLIDIYQAYTICDADITCTVMMHWQVTSPRILYGYVRSFHSVNLTRKFSKITAWFIVKSDINHGYENS